MMARSTPSTSCAALSIKGWGAGSWRRWPGSCGSGARSAIVWSARDNAPARQFYQGLGGTLVGEGIDSFLGHPIVDVAYAWPVIDELTRIDAMESP
jgi:hypothetical protein